MNMAYTCYGVCVCVCACVRVCAYAPVCVRVGSLPRPDMIRSVSLDLYIILKYMRVVEWVKGQAMQAVSEKGDCLVLMCCARLCVCSSV